MAMRAARIILSRAITLVLALISWACLLPSTTVADVAGSRDSPLLSRYPGAEIVAYEARDWDAAVIADDRKSHWATGKLTWIVYQAPATNSTLQVYRNYLAALIDADFDVAFVCELEGCGRDFIKRYINSTGRMVGGMEHWMPGSGRYVAARKSDGDGDSIWISLLVHERDRAGTVAIRETIVEPAKPRTVDLEKTFDRNFVGARRFGGFHRKYDEAKVPVAVARDGELTDVLSLEGDLSWWVYALPRHVSRVEAMSSYRTAMDQAGFEPMFYCERGECGRNFMHKSLQLGPSIAENGDHWIEDSEFYLVMRRESAAGTSHLAMWGYRQPSGYDAVRLFRVLSKPLQLGLVKVSAETMASELRKTGKVRIYGIYFDVDKARVRADSRSVLDEIARMLKANSDIALHIDGHTDSQGDDRYNLDLSERRAAAVVAALVENYGIDSTRLEARGFGESRPVASNDTGTGRAKNRRVELVVRQDAN